MAWWMWLIIWVLLVALLIAVLALSGWSVFRVASGLGEDLDRLSQELDRLAPDDLDDDAVLTPPNAIVAGRAAALAQRREFETARDERRSERREARLARARELIAADPMQYAHLIDKNRREA